MSFERRPALTHEILTQLGLIILFVDGKVKSNILDSREKKLVISERPEMTRNSMVLLSFFYLIRRLNSSTIAQNCGSSSNLFLVGSV